MARIIYPEDKFILSLDSGGSQVRAILFDTNGIEVNRHEEKTPWLSPVPGAQEHDPSHLWKMVVKCIQKVIKKTKITPSQIATIGITNQRASFLLWDKATGKPISNLISWADVRSANTCDQMNRNPQWTTLKGVASILGTITQHPMLLTTNLLKFTTDHATTRLKWFLDINPGLRPLCKSGKILFGTVDSWIIYNLTGGKSHLTDPSNAAATGLFNPFSYKWNSILLRIFNLPMNIFPKVIDSNGHYGTCDPELFGAPIPINGVLGDQMAALFGHSCFNKGDVKISQGSGSFVDINVGNKPKLSKRGLFPMIAWSLSGTPTYMMEGYVATAGTLIDWLGHGIGLSSSAKELNHSASLCNDTEGVIVIPSASGIRYPYFNPRTRASILGLSLSTKKSHVARAVLEGIAFRLIDILTGMKKDTKTPIRMIKVDGGVSNSNILLQALADYSNIQINRSNEKDMASIGIAYIAGYGCGIWKTLDEIASLQQEYQTFTPHISESKRQHKLNRWNEAIHAIIKIDKIPVIGHRDYFKD